MAGKFYEAGKKPQYGKARWERYESLRENGFSKEEARTLSRSTSPQAKSVVRNMIRQRHDVLLKFFQKAGEEQWDYKTARQKWFRYLKDWYNAKGYTSKQGRRTPAKDGGKPDVWVWYNRTENRMASQRGWHKKDDTGPVRRPKKKTPTRKDYKGNVRKQRARARTRARAMAERPTKGVPLDRLERWLKDSQNMKRKDATSLTEQKRVESWRADLRKRIRHAEQEQAAGRAAVG